MKMVKMDFLSKTETEVTARKQVMDMLTLHVEECERPLKAVPKSPKKLQSSVEKLLPFIVSHPRKPLKRPTQFVRRSGSKENKHIADRKLGVLKTGKRMKLHSRRKKTVCPLVEQGVGQQRSVPGSEQVRVP